MKRNLLTVFIFFCLIFVCDNIYSQTTYTWNIAGGGSWATAANWTPARNAPAANDILRFTNGGTKIITSVPTQTIGKLQITGNSNITLQAVNSGTPILTVSTAAADAIDVDAGSTLQLQGYRPAGTDYSLTLTTTNTVGLQAAIDGTVIVKLETANRPATLGVFTKGGANATINFNSGALYTHSVDASLIPIGTWNATSTCNVTGVTNTAPSNLNQAFGNFTWNCSHSAPINLLGALTTVNGSFTVSRTGVSTGNSGRVLNGLTLCTSGTYTLNVGGDINITNPLSESSWLMITDGNANATINVSGNFNMSGPSNTTFFDFKYSTLIALGSLVMNIAGNYNQTGGYLDWTFQTSASSNFTSIYLGGNFSFTGSSIMITSTATATIPNGKIFFNKAGTQTVTVSTATNLVYTNFEVLSGSTVELLSSINLQSSTNAPWGGKFIVNSGAILDANTNQIASSSGLTGGSNNAFTLNSAAGIITANVNGLHQTGFVGPTISAALATRTFSSGANYTYDGSALQVSGTFITTPVANQVNNLTINNTAPLSTGVTLQQEIKVAGICEFISGVFTTTNTNILTINDNATMIGTDLDAGSSKYVNGPLKKIGNDPFAFAVGKQSHGCRPIFISAPSTTTAEFRAELIRGNAGLLGPITASGLQKVSGCEYWYLDRLVGSSAVDVSLSWSGESPCNAQSYVTDLPNLVVAHFNGTSWDTYGNDGGTIGDAVKGAVTWNSVSTFSPFSLGSLVWWTNPLTVKFINLQANEKNGQVKIEWANIAETGVDKYFVEYSTDGSHFDDVNNSNARKNNGERTDYLWWHATPGNGIIYYRIKAAEFTGDVTYSRIVRLDLDKKYPDLTVFPNPVKGNNITIGASGLAAGKYDMVILNMSGQKIMQRSLNHAGGSISMQVDLPATIKAGLYSIRISGGEKILVTTFLVQ